MGGAAHDGELKKLEIVMRADEACVAGHIVLPRVHLRPKPSWSAEIKPRARETQLARPDDK